MRLLGPLTTCLLLLASAARAPGAFAQEAAPPSAAPSKEAVKEAGERFQKGVRFFRDAEYRAALLEFQRAYELAPNYRVLYNLGQTSRELKDHASALGSFERYLAEGGAEIDPKRRRDVEKWIEELRPKVARIVVTTSVDGAEITVDDLPSGTSPLAAPLRVNAGRRKVAATLAGHLPVQRFVDLAGADEVAVSFELVPLSAPPEPAAPQPPPPQPEPTRPPAPRDEGGSAWPWVGLATTGAFGIATTILGVRALGAQSDFEDRLGQRSTAAEIDDARGKAEGFALATDIGFGLTGAAAVTTVILFIVDGNARSDAAGGPRLHAGPTSVVAEGDF